MGDSLSLLERSDLRRQCRGKRIALAILLGLVVIFFFLSLMVGPANIGMGNSFLALFGVGEASSVRIVQKIRLPETIAAVVAGAGLSIAGLMMQSTLKNPLASPSTLGVSNAAVFGANLSIIAFAGGFLNTGNHPDQFMTGVNPYATGLVAFGFALLSSFAILILCRIRSFAPEVVVLAGLAMGTVWTALTSLLQYYATDVGLSAAVVWSFGDLSRATFETDWIMFAVVLAAGAFFYFFQWKFNVLSGDEAVASSVGVRVALLRFVALAVSSLVTAVCVSILGIIGFVGIICPHAMRRIVGNNHRFLIPGSLLSGSLLLLISMVVSALVGNGSALPVGAITALLGGPFFLYLVFAKKGEKA